MSLEKEGKALVFKKGGETLRIEAWGKNALRVRSTMQREFTGLDWALTEKPEESDPEIKFFEVEYSGDGFGAIKNTHASIANGRVKAEISYAGILSFYRDDKLVLREYYRSYGGTLSKESRCLKTINREWKGVIGGTGHSLSLKFESNDGEKIFGIGQ